MNKIGRNEPCPCGSGKKYKKCCLPKTYPVVGKEESLKQSLVQNIMGFAKKKFKNHINNAYDYFWDDFDPEEHLDDDYLQNADINFWEWVVHDWTPYDDGRTLIDHFIESNKRLTSDELKMLTIMNQAPISLYEVQEVFPEKGIILKDILLGGEYDVREKMATRTVRKWDIFATRLLYLDGQYIMSGCVYPYSVRQKESIIKYLNEVFEDFKKDYPDARLDEFLKSEGDLFNFLWYDQIKNPSPVKLMTTSGEPLLFSKALFEITDQEAALERLKKIKEFEREEDRFVWLKEPDKNDSATVLGSIILKGSQLILECNSKERLEEGKNLLKKHLADLVIHRLDTFQDPFQAMESLKEMPQEKIESQVPIEIQQQFYTQFMQKHCEEWLHEKILALDGQTPMEAVKTEDGRIRVRELLKSFENAEEHNKREGRPYYDVSWMWERLNLERE